MGCTKSCIYENNEEKNVPKGEIPTHKEIKIKKGN